MWGRVLFYYLIKQNKTKPPKPQQNNQKNHINLEKL